MAEHNTLTGSSLHENKGVAAATDDFVATATTGATVWKKLTANNLTTTGNPFGAQLFQVRDQVASGTASQSSGLTNNTWTARRFQTSVVNEIASASLASNQITLPAGTYYIEAWICCRMQNNAGTRSSIRLRNMTDGSTTLVGANQYGNGGGTIGVFEAPLFLRGRFTIAGTKTFEIHQYANVNAGTVSTGDAVSSGENEVYAECNIWKIL